MATTHGGRRPGTGRPVGARTTPVARANHYADEIAVALSDVQRGYAAADTRTRARLAEACALLDALTDVLDQLQPGPGPRLMDMEE